MTDTAAPTVHSLIFKMEHDIGEAFRFGNALTMAIEGLGKACSIETEDEAGALRTLAWELCCAIEKVRQQWKELCELSDSQEG